MMQSAALDAAEREWRELGALISSVSKQRTCRSFVDEPEPDANERLIDGSPVRLVPARSRS